MTQTWFIHGALPLTRWPMQVLTLLLVLPNCAARNPKHVVVDDPKVARARHRRKPRRGQQGPEIKGLHFWQHASFDPWAASHEHNVPPEYLGLSEAEKHWMPQEEWFARRNLTQRIEHLFPMIDANRDGLVELAELEKWHHINKVFVEKARAAQSMVRSRFFLICALRHIYHCG